MRTFHLRDAAAGLVRPLATAAAAAALSCGERGTAGPGIPAPASIAVAPAFQSSVADGPIIVLDRVAGWLVPIPAADSVFGEATFDGGQAALELDVLVVGPEQRFVFRLDAFDAAAERIFASTDTIDVRAGEDALVDGIALEYVARDADVTAFTIRASSLALAVGDTVHLNAQACCADGQQLFPVRAGWRSRDPLVAAVDRATGIVSAVAPGRVWMVATLFNGTVDSTEVSVGPVSRTWIGGDPAAPADWMNGANWSPHGAPASDDTAVVSAAAYAPALLLDATVASLLLDPGASLRVDGTLVIAGNLSGIGGDGSLTNGGVIGGTGTLAVWGDVDALSSTFAVSVLRLGGAKGTTRIGALGAGHTALELLGETQPLRSGLAYRDVRVAGSALLAGPEAVTFDGSLRIEGDAAELAPAGTPLTVTGDLVTGRLGVLALRNDADDVTVKGAVTIGGGPTSSALLYGTLRVARDFAVTCKTAECFMPSPNGTLVVAFEGTETQTVSLTLPGAPGQGGALQQFRHIRVTNRAGVTFATGTPVMGNLAVDAASLATIPAGVWVDVADTLFVERSGSEPGRIENYGELFAGVDDSGGTVGPNPVQPRK